MTSIVVPRLIGTDTSVLGNLAGDLASSADNRRRAGEQFIAEMSNRGWIPVVCFESLLELLRHGNTQTVCHRISMLGAWPQLAYVDSLRNPGQPGSVVDVLAREVRAVLSDETSAVQTIAEAVRKDLFGFCDGRTMVGWLNENVKFLRQYAQRSHLRGKLLSSISHIDVLGVGKSKARDYQPDDRISQAEIRRHGIRLHDHIAAELHSRGVKEVDHDAFAEHFAQDSEAILLAIAGHEECCTAGQLVEGLLQDHGIDPAQINKGTTVDDVAALAGFNHKLRVASKVLRLLRPVTASEVPIDKCPSEIIKSGVDDRRRSAPRAQPGDLFDSTLSVLACYCDITIVDKRTNEYMRQLRKQNALANALIRRVVCLSKYTDLLLETL